MYNQNQLTIILFPEWLTDDDGCRTPDRGVGNCIIINSCKPMIDFISKNQPLSPQAITLLRSYQCGFEQNKVKVCCPPNAINIRQTVTTTTAAPVSGDPLPPDVSRHRNLNLLPRSCGPLPSDERITNGNKTELYEFPWMVLISYQTGKLKHQYTPMIIDSKHSLCHQEYKK